MIYFDAVCYVTTFIACSVYLNRQHHRQWRYVAAFAITAAGALGCFLDLFHIGLDDAALWDFMYRGGVAATIILHFGFDRRAAAKRAGPFERRLL